MRRALRLRIGLGVLFIGFKCGLLSSLQALAYPSQDARRIPGVATLLSESTHRVRGTSNGIATARRQRQLESLSPHGLGSLLDQ